MDIKIENMSFFYNKIIIFYNKIIIFQRMKYNSKENESINSTKFSDE
jgi:hypothetical protein